MLRVYCVRFRGKCERFLHEYEAQAFARGLHRVGAEPHLSSRLYQPVSRAIRQAKDASRSA